MLLCEDQAAFFKRVREGISGRQAGARDAPLPATVSFESLASFRSVLTPARARLLDTVNQHGPFDSVQALAAALCRSSGAVNRDTLALAALGLLRTQGKAVLGAGRDASRLQSCPAC